MQIEFGGPCNSCRHVRASWFVRETDALQLPGTRGLATLAAGVELGPEDQIAALMAVCETADLATDLACVKFRALRLPEQRFVAGLIEEGP